MTATKPSLSYRDAGVDIDAGNALIDRIKPLARATMRPGVLTDVGGFGGLFGIDTAQYPDPVLVSGTDGVGTKLKLAFEMDKHDTIGIDLVAMCVNDVIVQGAEPLFFLDYFATGKLSQDQATDVIKGISDGCAESGCALLGGETAEVMGEGVRVLLAERGKPRPSPLRASLPRRGSGRGRWRRTDSARISNGSTRSWPAARR